MFPSALIELFSTVSKLFTGDLTMEERKVVNALMFRLGWRALLTLHILWACGWLTIVGLQGFAQSSEVDNKISKAVEPIITKLEKQDTILNTLSLQLKKTLSEGKASEMRLLARQRCPTQRTAATDLESLNKEIERKQVEFEELVGYRYSIPDCQQLL